MSLRRKCKTYLVAAVVGVLVGACMEQPEQPVTPSFNQQATTRGGAVLGRELRQGDDRKNTRWQRMTDIELAEAVAGANGRVMIGLKDADQADGVDNSGRILASNAAMTNAKAQLRQLGVAILREFEGTPMVIADITPEMVAPLRANPLIDYVEPSTRGEWEAQVTPWNVTKVGAPSSWSLSSGGSGVKVLVIDTGHDSTHSDLYIPVSWRCVGGPMYDSDGHGTAVTGVIGALWNFSDVVGVAYGADVWTTNISDGTGPLKEEVACAINLARINGVFAVNMSFFIPDTSTAVNDAINTGYSAGMLFIKSAGNTNGGGVTYPGTLANVIAVTAVDSNNSRPSFTAISSKIELAAPGVAVLTTSLGGGTGYYQGTSFAAPHVTGAAALLKARYPSWSNTTIRNRLNSTATDLGASGHDNTYGHGLLNIYKAITMQVGVGGPSFVYSGYPETWNAIVSGGQSSYSYQWYLNGSAAGTSSSLYHNPGGSDFWIKLTVTDALSFSASDSLYVQVSNCTPPDIFC